MTAAHLATGRMRILIVEDDRDVREALAAILEERGYGFCMILLDLFMPEMNGWAFRREQMKDPELAGIPVLVISADSGAAKRAMTPGVVATMTKPVELDRLLQIVAQHC